MEGCAVENEMRVTGLDKGVASDWETWRIGIHEPVNPASKENGRNASPACVFVCLCV